MPQERKEKSGLAQDFEVWPPVVDAFELSAKRRHFRTSDYGRNPLIHWLIGLFLNRRERSGQPVVHTIRTICVRPRNFRTKVKRCVPHPSLAREPLPNCGDAMADV
jgi:hypothetical protein